MNEALGASASLGVAEGVHRAVDLAREAAQVYGSTRVGTEHLLLGLLQQRRRRKNFVAWCLGEFNVTERKVRELLEAIWEPDGRAGQELEFAFTPRLRGVIERAWREARRLGYDKEDDLGTEYLILGTEHLLLGLLGESEGQAARVLADLDVDRNQARQTVMRMLGAEE